MSDTDREFVSIKEVKYIGEKQTYDLEVDSEDHLYCLYNGVVNQNSHSTAYGFITYQTAYLKTYYTTEFICAVLTTEYQKSDEKLEICLAKFKYEYPIAESYTLQLLHNQMLYKNFFLDGIFSLHFTSFFFSFSFFFFIM